MAHAWRLYFYSCFVLLVVSVEDLKGFLPASEILCMLSPVLFASFMAKAPEETGYYPKLRSRLWVFNEAFNILYLCMSSLLRNAYLFDVSFDNTPQRPFCYEIPFLLIRMFAIKLCPSFTRMQMRGLRLFSPLWHHMRLWRIVQGTKWKEINNLI